MRIRRVFPNGGSKAITLPAEFGFKIGDYVKLREEKGRIVLEKVEG